MERDESLRLRDRGDLDDEVLRVVVRGLELDEASRSRHDSSGWPGIDARPGADAWSELTRDLERHLLEQNWSHHGPSAGLNRPEPASTTPLDLPE